MVRKHSLDNYIKLVCLYMEFRQVQKLGYLPYSHYKNLIKYCLSGADQKTVRRIFDMLRYRNVFSVHSHGAKGHNKKYLFNPFDRPHRMRMNYLVDFLD